MRIFPGHRMLASTAGLALLCGPALADVTAQDVWTNWQAYMKEAGYDLTASEEAGSGVLVVKDVEMRMAMPEDDGQTSLTMRELSFVENGDGTVSVSVSNNLPISFAFDDGDEDVAATLVMSHQGLTTVASGSPEEIVYTYGAVNIALTLQDLMVDGMQVDDLDGEVAVANLAGTQHVSIGENFFSKDAITAEKLSIMVKGIDPDSGGNIDLTMALVGLQGRSEGTLPFGSFAGSPSAMFGEDLSLLSSYTMQSAALAAAFEDEDGPGQINLTTGAGASDIEMNDELMSYSGEIADIETTVMAPDVPLPIDVSFGELGYDLNVPLKASEEAQDFGLSLKFNDISLSDFLWNMFDPGAVLPRDAASLLVDLSGRATLFEDLVSLDEDISDIPGEVNAVSIDALMLSAAGADISGTGSFTFDNSDMVSFDGFPRPEGAVDLKINGINGLLDSLVTMGLLPAEQAMPVRMMLGMFTVPQGEDQLTSRIEVNDQGHVLANGQRLK
ncbi:hypothetical protein shim_26660 [Shimia sp. SK013]|uniref:DUF2125 domain-containing protein n=1 Tax=Shimia sp. SK013 TaxID=1389006 RepID=UPI0006CCABE7|nr:DUF2125 domain-containing protein [Shimia sp. SK013]KPA21201.1 hypothetical protein shim_26660 [Shimia sp. SK013]